MKIKEVLSRKWVIILIVLAVAGISYFAYQKTQEDEQETKYVESSVEKGSITVSVSGTGQVAVSNQVDIKPEASGKVYYANVVNGQKVKAGDLLVQLDATDALKSVRDAEANLESAKLSLTKLIQPADDLSITKSKNNLANAKESKTAAESDLEKSYEDGFNDVADAFLDLPSVISGLNDLLFDSDLSDSQNNLDYYTDRGKKYDSKMENLADKALEDYRTARDYYDQNFDDYKNVSRYSDEEVISNLISQTYDTTKYIAEAVKSINNFIDYYEDLLSQASKDINSATTSHQNTLENYTGTTNSHLNSLLNIKNYITNAKQDIINADRNIEEKSGELQELLAGVDALDIQSQELSIKQKENSLADAQEKLADYYIRAPFDGIIAEVNVQKGESVSTGTVIATLITHQKLAEITLNEIDVAKVAVGQKTTLTFDAVEDLSITGEVAEIDTLGTVSQGIVSYDVKIAFDLQDERIKPGMSLGTDIIIESKRNILVVPSSAVKSVGDTDYVEVLKDGQVQRQNITTGISNDIMIEVIEGLEEGDQIITQTISGSSASSDKNTQGGNQDAMRSMMRMTR